MVGDDAIQRAVFEPLQNRLSVLFLADGRIHLGVRVETRYQIVRGGEIVGAGFRRDLDAGALGVADQPNAAERRNVADMHGYAEAFREADLAGDAHVLRGAGDSFQSRQRGIVALVDDSAVRELLVLAVTEAFHVKPAGVFHGEPHQTGAFHRLAVVGDRHGARFFHLPDIRQLFPFLSLRNGADGTHFAEIYFLRAMADIAYHHLVVRDRRGVRHTANLRKAALYGRLAAAFDVFLVFEAGFSQMHVHINEPGEYVQAFRVDDFLVFLRG